MARTSNRAVISRRRFLLGGAAFTAALVLGGAKPSKPPKPPRPTATPRPSPAPTATPSPLATGHTGAMMIDTTNSRIYVRVGSTWKYVSLT